MQRYFAIKKDINNFILDSKDIHHIGHVMRMKTGEKVEVIYDHELYSCYIDINNDDIEVIINEKLNVNNIDNKQITLVLPLLKGQKMDMIIQKSTELGVNEIIPVIMKRSIVDISNKELKKLDRWQRIAKEASEQSMRLDIPKISEVRDLSYLNNIDGLKIVCSTTEKANNIKTFLQNNTKYDRIIIVVGPEGGLTPDEENSLVENGFTRVTLGKRIMRVETVPIYILSIINYENME
jgi:16S rRNA (uracil1498-N3)-methyltransferase